MACRTNRTRHRLRNHRSYSHWDHRRLHLRDHIMLKQFHRLEPLDSFLYHCSSLLPEEGFSSRVKTRARCQTSLRRLRRQSAQGRTNIAAGEIEEKLSEKDPA